MCTVSFSDAMFEIWCRTEMKAERSLGELGRTGNRFDRNGRLGGVALEIIACANAKVTHR